MTPYRRWRYALKPASWPKLFVPAFVGQAIGAAHLGGVDLVSAAGGLGLTFLLLGAIVLSNDLADREVDGLKRRLFPTSCSPKTIPDGILSAGHVALGALVFTAAAVGFGYFCNEWLGRPLMGIATLGALAVFAGYSLWPLKLNYRGGGELLEMFGVGLVLPWINAYAQGGLGVESLTWLPRPWAILPGVCALAFASAIASGLSDEVSDRKGGKRTFTTMLGNPMARRFTELNVLLAAIFWLLAGIFSAHIPLVVAVFGALVLAYYLRTLVALSPAAVTNAFDAQRRYKDVLHRAFWNSAQWLAGLLVLHRLFF